MPLQIATASVALVFAAVLMINGQRFAYNRASSVHAAIPAHTVALSYSSALDTDRSKKSCDFLGPGRRRYNDVCP
jgi:hypothetical protein